MVTGLIFLRSGAGSHSTEFTSALVLLYLEDTASPWSSTSDFYSPGSLDIEERRGDVAVLSVAEHSTDTYSLHFNLL